MNKRILLIKDDMSVSRALTVHLQDTTTDVESLLSAREALDSLFRRRYCLIILSLELKEKDGVALLKHSVYKNVTDTSTFALAEKVISDTFKQIYVPFITLYCMLVIVPSGMVIYAILAGILPLPLWCILFNPVVFQLFGLLLRATKLKCFIDAPSICAARLGLAMYGVLVLIL